MNDLYIEGSHCTPTTVADWNSGMVRMAGDSCPENSFEAFGEVIAWIAHFLGASQRPLTLDLRITYMNTSSVNTMMDILDMLGEAHRSGRHVAVNWFCDARNERVAELAAAFREDCEFPFAIAADAR